MTQGIHHITAIASDAQETVDFFTQILGLRLVKKSVNQDDVQTYHLFFGDRLGEPGMDLTFFIFLPPFQGVQGNGSVSRISLAVPQASLSFWQQRLEQHGVRHEQPSTRFGLQRIVFFDSDNQCFELVGVERALPDKSIWTTKEISESEAIRSFHSATLSVESISSIEPVLTKVFGYTPVGKDQHLHLFRAKDSTRAELLEVSETPSGEAGSTGAGTVHHIAFRARDTEHQLELRRKVEEIGLYPTEVINRFYFRSVYFRTRAGILFEIATDGPGFTADEKEEELGMKLALPPFLEPERKMIEAQVKPIRYEP